LAVKDPVLFLESASAFTTNEMLQAKGANHAPEGAAVRDVRDARRRGFMQAIEARLLPFEASRSAAVLRQLRAL
jgi:hypothetical protein